MAAKSGGGAILTLGMIASLLVAAAGTGYCDGMDVPARDSERQPTRQLDQAEQQAQRRLASQQPAAETTYRACVAAAGAAHESSWAAQCQNLAEENAHDRTDCLSKLHLSDAYCDASYPVRDGSAHCALPEELATVIDAALARSRNRCQREQEAAAPQ